MMDPSQSKSSSGASRERTNAGGLTETVNRVYRRIPSYGKIPRTAWVVAALLVLLIAALGEIERVPSPPGAHRPTRWSSEWLRTPLRLYPERTLPAFDKAVIWAVEITPTPDNTKVLDSRHHRLWIAGEGGLLAYSDDQGQQWTLYQYDPASGTMFLGANKPTPWRPSKAAPGPAAPAQKKSPVTPPQSNSPANGSENPKKQLPGKKAAAALWDLLFAPVRAASSPDESPKQSASPSRQDQAQSRAQQSAAAQQSNAPQQQKASQPDANSPVQTKGRLAESPANTPPQAQVARQDINSAQIKLPAINSTGQAKIGKPREPTLGEPPKTPPDLMVVSYDETLGELRLFSSTGDYLIGIDGGINGITWSRAVHPLRIAASPSDVRGCFETGRFQVCAEGKALRAEHFPVSRRAAVTLPDSDQEITSVGGVESRGGIELAYYVKGPGFDSQRPLRASGWVYMNGLVSSGVQVNGIDGKETIWAAGDSPEFGGVVYASADRGRTWQGQLGWQGCRLLDVKSLSTGRTSYAVGVCQEKAGAAAAGAIFGTNDGGQNWLPITLGAAVSGRQGSSYHWWQQPVRLPAPLTSILLAVALFLAIPIALPDPAAARPTIVNKAVTDQPITSTEQDALNFAPLVEGLSGFLRNSATELPVTVAIDGGWGTGKSSLMLMLKNDLAASGLHTVWFNVWHHQEESSLLAALLQTVRKDAPPSFALPLEAMRFYLRLALRRLWRYRGQALMLAAVGLALYAFENHLQTTYREYWTAVVSAFKKILPDSVVGLFRVAGAAGVGGTFLTYLYALLQLFPRTLHSLRAFGVNPASLLSSESGRKKIGDLDAQTTFRKDFRLDFGDVTWALGTHRLVIFLDDLDRCQPEKIGEALEAVNYLINAGRCAVVLGLERQKVQAGLGLYFQKMAEETEPGCAPEKMATDSPWSTSQVAPPQDDADSVVAPRVKPDTEEVKHEQRRKFAEHYIEKLLNLVVKIPPLTDARFADLLTGRQTPENRAAEARARRIETYANGLQRFAVWMAIVAIIYGASLGISDALGKAGTASLQAAAEAPAPPNSQQSPSTGGGAVAGTNDASGGSGSAQPIQSGSQPASVSAGATPAAGSTSSGSPHPAPNYRPPRTSLPERWFDTWWQQVAGVVLLVGLIVPLFTRRKGVSTGDEPEFSAALRIWAGVLKLINPSPRAAKRFLNRVRYLAMLDRPPEADRPAWRRWLARQGELVVGWLRNLRFFFRKTFGRNGTEASEPLVPSRPGSTGGTDGEGVTHIPDPLLVALAVIYEAAPDAFSSLEMLKRSRLTEDGNGKARTGVSAESVDRISEAWSELQAQFKGISVEEADKHLPRFLNLSSGFLSQ